jgi:hypothetical protein
MSGEKKWGFGTFDKDKLKETASAGGKAAHAKGTAYKFTPEMARAAALKGAEKRRLLREAAAVAAPVEAE